MNNIRRGLAWHLVNPDCADFIDEVLSRAATGDNPRVQNGGRNADVLDIFDMVRGGIVRGNPAGGGQTTGSIAGGHPGVLMAPTLFGGNPTASEKTSGQLGLDTCTVA